MLLAAKLVRVAAAESERSDQESSKRMLCTHDEGPSMLKMCPKILPSRLRKSSKPRDGEPMKGRRTHAICAPHSREHHEIEKQWKTHAPPGLRAAHLQIAAHEAEQSDEAADSSDRKR